MIDAESNGHYVVSWTSPSGPEHQAFIDPAPAARLRALAHAEPGARTDTAGADLSGAISGAVAGHPASGFERAGLSALHPFASAAVALTNSTHMASGLHAQATSFSFV